MIILVHEDEVCMVLLGKLLQYMLTKLAGIVRRQARVVWVEESFALERIIWVVLHYQIKRHHRTRSCARKHQLDARRHIGSGKLGPAIARRAAQSCHHLVSPVA